MSAPLPRDALKGFDPLAPDALDRIAGLREQYAAQTFPTRRVFAAALSDEDCAAFYALCDLMHELAVIEGAQRILARLHKAEHHQLAQAQSRTVALEKRVEGQAAHIAQLEATIARLKAKAPPQSAPTRQPPAPTWDYKPVERRRSRPDEVVTESPFAVEVVARQVEDYVNRVGRCSKPDVSAALPALRPYLATAYKHLHESRRVRVDGWTLEPWPSN